MHDDLGPEVLYESDRHRPLAATEWEPARAEATVREILDETVGAYEDGLWPAHPRDYGPKPSAALYEGAAGVLTALERLKLRDYDLNGFDLDRAWRETWDVFRRNPPEDQNVPSLLCGASGILLGAFGALGAGELADRLHECVRSNTDHPARDLMWGAPGTMVAALQMYEWTTDNRWIDAYRRSARLLWHHWRFDEQLGCHVWTQRSPRGEVRYLGACHGQLGNLDALLRGREFLPEDARSSLLERTEQILSTFAVEENGLVNWPAVAAEPQPRMIQWCHGATGAITSLHSLPAGVSEVVDDLLRGAGELVWRAGPLRKGPNICHGTSGSGYALLKLHDRTGDSKWLERARRFAMDAVEQYREIRDEWERAWYSLYTGDLGLAVFLHSCIDVDSDLPGLDIWPRRAG